MPTIPPISPRCCCSRAAASRRRRPSSCCRRALELQPGNPQARYYLATMKDMRGDHRGAVDDLIALLREAPADAPWEPQVREAAVDDRAPQQYRHCRPPARRRRQPPAVDRDRRHSRARRASRWSGARDRRRASRTRWCRAWSSGSPRGCARIRATSDGWIMLMRSRMVLQQPDRRARRCARPRRLPERCGDPGAPADRGAGARRSQSRLSRWAGTRQAGVRSRRGSSPFIPIRLRLPQRWRSLPAGRPWSRSPRSMR